MVTWLMSCSQCLMLMVRQQAISRSLVITWEYLFPFLEDGTLTNKEFISVMKDRRQRGLNKVTQNTEFVVSSQYQMFFFFC